MKILVTGATGFIGSFIVEEGLRRRYDLYAGVRATSNTRSFPEKVHVAVLTLSNKERLREELTALGRFDYIIHNAGVTKCKRKQDFDDVNYRCTRNFLEALIESDTVPTKFLYVSSLAAFGPGNPKTLEPIRLTDTPHPDTLYGKSKLKAEQFIFSLPESFPYLIVRPTGVYGPREKDYFVFLQTVNRHLEPAMGFGKQHLTFIYVTDLVKVMFKALESPYTRRAWFVADGKEYDNRQYGQIVRKHLHRWALYLPVPLFLVKAIAYTLDTVCGWFGFAPTLNRDKYNMLRVMNWRCEVAPLQKELDFEAEYDLDRGIKACVDWYKKEKWL